MTEHELFKEAVMQYLIDDASVRHVVQRERSHRVARRILAAAACLLIVTAITVMSIPSARAAVSSWVSQWFSTRNYLGQESESRTQEPTIEAITHKYDGAVPVTITDVGPDAFAQTMANEFGLCIDEIAYNGKTIYLTGWFTGQSGKFLLDWYTGAFAWNEVGTMIDGSMDFTMPNGDLWIGGFNLVFTDEIRAIMKDAAAHATLDAAGCPVRNLYGDAQWQAYMEEHGVRFTMDAYPARDAADPLSGVIEARLSFREFYYREDEDRTVKLFDADLGTVRIDADSYKAGVQESVIRQSAALSGVHRVLINEWLNDQGDGTNNTPVCYYNSELDFSGMTLTLESICFRPDDTELTIHATLPEDWSLAERVGVAQGGMELMFLLDGKPADMLFSAHSLSGEAPCYEFTHPYLGSTISPSRWVAAKTLTIIPYTSSPNIMSAIDDDDPATRREVEMVPGAVIYGNANVTRFSDEDSLVIDRMDEFAITINLDDYR